MGQNIGCNNLTCGSACNVGSLVSGGAISGTTITGTGNLTVGANNMTCGNLICSNTVSCWGVSSSGAISGTTITGTGALNVGTNTITCGTVSSSGNVNCGAVSCQNLFLPTTGGTATTLNYYEEYSYSGVWVMNGGGGTTATATVKIVRIGKVVNLKLYAFTLTTTASSIIMNGTYLLPTRFIPSSSTEWVIGIQNNSVMTTGTLYINVLGAMILYASAGGIGSFTAAGVGGLVYDTYVTWIL